MQQTLIFVAPMSTTQALDIAIAKVAITLSVCIKRLLNFILANSMLTTCLRWCFTKISGTIRMQLNYSRFFFGSLMYFLNVVSKIVYKSSMH